MADYLHVVYNESATPYTEYPKKLCHYLAQAFNIKRGMRLLEIGCGRGEFLSHFKDMGAEVYGVDLSPEAKNLSKDLAITQCNLERDKLSFEDNYFDVVFNKSFLEHLRDPENFFTEAYRTLKPGGLLLTLVPDWESQYKTFFDDHTHNTPYTINSLRDVYKIFSFENVKVQKFRQLPLTWKYPFLNKVCSLISPLIPVRTKGKFLRWSRELMLIGEGRKPLR